MGNPGRVIDVVLTADGARIAMLRVCREVRRRNGYIAVSWSLDGQRTGRGETANVTAVSDTACSGESDLTSLTQMVSSCQAINSESFCGVLPLCL